MESNQSSLSIFINEQLKKWEKIRAYTKTQAESYLPVITICVEAGSGGSIVAQGVADNLGFDLFHHEIIQAIAESGKIDPAILESMEKERPAGVQDFIASLLNDRYLWPGVYLDHLKKVVHAISERGGAVIVGRGANFILSPANIISVRVVAPLEVRIKNVTRAFHVLDEEAKRRILNRDSRRSTFVKRSFNHNIDDGVHYDLIANTGRLSIEEAVASICTFWCRRHLMPETV